MPKQITLAEAKRRSDEIRKSETDARIRQALIDIKSDPLLKPTQEKLAELSGVHKTTLRAREWPFQELKKIKDDRKERKEFESFNSKNKAKSKKKEQKEYMHSIMKELYYWLNFSKQLERELDKKVHEIQRYKDSSKFYQKENEALKIQLESAKAYMKDFFSIDLDEVIKK